MSDCQFLGYCLRWTVNCRNCTCMQNAYINSGMQCACTQFEGVERTYANVAWMG